MQYSLDRAIHDAKFPNRSGQTETSSVTLTEQQQTAILEIVGKGCRAETKEKLARRLALPLSLFPTYGIFSRLILWDERDNRPYYIVGQDGNAERKVLRDCILKG